ncbi:hypothetical protein B0A52_07410 [Exophiala mesophila]|uniref:Uncharacterized protein n=1 Tax=Exophiala mesophila TaxID=212818 RepID=A0A438MXD1_EXOME|nr:hypothetical protein B0A52_07410 [Exophiala mesophila]
MHLSSCLLLPALASMAAAQAQIPFKDKATELINKAKDLLPNSGPIEAGSAYIAGTIVERINIRNWERKLSPKLDTEEEWMVYVTGGNKSCFGRCGPIDAVWNQSVPLLTALPQSSTAPLHLGLINCEKDTVLCTAWATVLPAIYHFSVPKKTEPQAPVPLHIITLNLTSTTTNDIVTIPSTTKARYLDYPEYNGALHPFDGMLAKLGLHIPFGYLLWGFGTIPSWAMMLVISYFSRRLMNKRINNSPDYGAPAAQAPVAPAAAQAQTPARPAGGAPKSGGKKRK